jgi:hypothetical protein
MFLKIKGQITIWMYTISHDHWTSYITYTWIPDEHMRKIMKGKSSNFTKEAYAKSAATRMGKKRGPYKKRDSNVR